MAKVKKEKRVSVRLSVTYYQALHNWAFAADMSFSDFVRRALITGSVIEARRLRVYKTGELPEEENES
jgi:predicted DNA binding CopG/RHH family protein